MTIYTPNQWVIIKITNQELSDYRILASWNTLRNPWKLNSGINYTKIDNDTIMAYGDSGSGYTLNDDATSYGMNSLAKSQLEWWQENPIDLETRIMVIGYQEAIKHLRSLETAENKT